MKALAFAVAAALAVYLPLLLCSLLFGLNDPAF